MIMVGGDDRGDDNVMWSGHFHHHYPDLSYFTNLAFFC